MERVEGSFPVVETHEEHASSFGKIMFDPQIYVCDDCSRWLHKS